MALTRLINQCSKRKIKIAKVNSYMDGFQVMFDGIQGDAILHDGSVGRAMFLWETYGMPWDNDDVSVHDADTLVQMISTLKHGKDWTQYER